MSQNNSDHYHPAHSNGGGPYMRNGGGSNGNGYVVKPSYHRQQPAPPVNSRAAAIPDDEMLQDETLYFERNRIQQLKDERIHIQKKTFTKWINSYLNKARLEVGDLFADFGDGILLIKFLEIISGEKLGKPNRGRMRVQKIENLNRCLEFLKHKRIQLENIGAEDILDGNERLILGLVWTIILRFTIENIEIESQESGEMKHAKEALLLWCQRKTLGYPNVKIDNFTSSWRNGLAFSALIHAHHPELLNFEALNPQDALGNLNNAFDAAERHLEIPRLLDAEDVNVSHPDEKSIITYVSLFYHCFAKQKTELTGARRVAKVVGELVQQDRNQDDFEQLASDLLAWIQKTIEWLENRHFPNSLKDMQDELLAFNQYRKVDKPPKYKEKGELEALFFSIQTKRTTMRRRVYTPPEGLYLHDVESAWNALDRAENGRQLALIAELQRQEKLELRAKIFNRKADMRDAWLREIIQVLKNFELHASVNRVEAASKMLRNISTEAGPKMSSELQTENYHGAEAVRYREREIIDRWNYFLALLRQKEKDLAGLKELTTLIRDMETLSAELKHLEPPLRSRDVGKHILAVEDLLQKHDLLEASVNANGDWLRNIKRQSLEYIKERGVQHEVLQHKLSELTHQSDVLTELCRERKMLLGRAKEYFQFVQNFEEEMGWLAEKEDFCGRVLKRRDVASVQHATRQYKVLESEMQAHWQRSKGIIGAGEHLQPTSVHTKEDVHIRIHALQSKWEELRRMVAALAKWLSEAEKACQYFQDVNDAESWIKEKTPLARSDDYGKDLSAAESLLSRHMRLEEEIQAYRADITRLDELAAQLAESEFNTAEAAALNGNGLASPAVDYDKGVNGGEVEEMLVPKLQMLYPYQGKGMALEQGEVLALLDKTNSDWWRVLKQDGVEGYAPANYCQVVAGETVTVSQQTPVKKPLENKREPSSSKSSILARQEAISTDYHKLGSLAHNRHRLLSDAVKLFKLFRECDDFEQWARGALALLQESPPADHIHAFKAKFQKQEAEVQTNGGTQVKRINGIADELLGENHSQSPAIRVRQRQVNGVWADLLELVRIKTSGLESALRLASFADDCADAKAWMLEKFELLRKQPEQGDIKALQALQRRYQNLERDLKPLDERMRNLDVMAGSIAKEHPEHKAGVERSVDELASLHSDLLKQARQRINEAEHQQGQQMFESAAQELLGWIEKTKQGIANETLVPAPAEELVKHHLGVRDEISAKAYEFDYVNELGQRLLTKNERLPNVKVRLGELVDGRSVLEEMWHARDADYKQLLELQMFTREADRIDSISKGHQAFLAIDNLGDSVEGVENLLKAHTEFESRLAAQEDRVRQFDASADVLIADQHQHAKHIDERRASVLTNREGVYALAKQRKAKLEQALLYENLRRNANELSAWIGEKERVARETAAAATKEATTGLDRKLLRHEAFVAELNSNAVQLQRVTEDGASLIAQRHYAEPKIAILLKELSANWEALGGLVGQNTRRLDDAETKKALLKMIHDANAKLADIERQLASDGHGSDLRGVKSLMQRKNAVDQEISQLEKRMTDISERAQQLVHGGHPDSKELSKEVDALAERFNALQGPLDRRRVLLEESLKWHQLAFNADVELQWIEEKRLVVETSSEPTSPAASLVGVTNALKKHDQLETELVTHRPNVESILAHGEELVHAGHPSSAQVESKCDQLSTAWMALSRAVDERRTSLDLALRKEHYLYDLAELEAWAAEKHQHLVTSERVMDELSAATHLASVKSTLCDMTVHKHQLTDLRGKCEELSAALPANEQELSGRQEKVEMDFNFLEELANKKAAEITTLIDFSAYTRDRADLEQWLLAKLQMARNDDCGRDFDHLVELQSKFEKFKQEVKVTGSDRFNQCEAMANAIMVNSSPAVAKEVAREQEQLHYAWERLVGAVEQRESRLKQAESLHRFARDAQEMHDRLDEKLAAMCREVGRDVKQAHQLILKHEAYESEVAQLGEQLKLLMAESEALRRQKRGVALEPSDDLSERRIAHRVDELAAVWHQLQEATSNRRLALAASHALQKFLSCARDFVDWATAMGAEMHLESAIKDLQSAEWTHQEHQRLRAEIEARLGEFTHVKQMGEQLLQSKHHSPGEIETKLSLVVTTYDSLKREWKLRNEWIEQMIDWHGYEREAQQTIDALRCKQLLLEAFNVASGVGSVQSADGQLRKLDTFQRALVQLEERVSAINSLSNQLIEKGHSESTNIHSLNQKVLSTLNALGERLDAVRGALDNATQMASFDAKVTEMTAWIDEKAHQTERRATEINHQALSLDEKLEQLRKHQSLEDELAVNAKRILQLQKQLGALRQRPPSTPVTASSVGVFERGDMMLVKWRELNVAVQQLDASLKEAKDLFEFNRGVERVMGWIREKELMLNAEDMGSDYEHAEALLHRLTRGDARDQDGPSAIRHVSSLGARLMANTSGINAESRSEVERQLREVNEAYSVLQERMDEYREALETALEVHRFNSDVDETNGRIHEKAVLLSTEDHGRDLAGVEQMLRKQDTIERDMSAIHSKLNDHDNEAKRLLSAGPPLRDSIIESLQKLERSWHSLAQLAHSRRLRLQQSYSLQKYFDSVKRLEQWANALRTKMTSYAKPRSVEDVQALLKTHEERLAEIESRNEELRALREYGQKIGAEQPEHKAEIQRAHRRLQNVEHQIRQTWEQENSALLRVLQLKMLQSQLIQVESWLASKEAVIAQQDLGDSIDAVNQLARNHDAFTQTLHSQSDKIDQLKQSAAILPELDGTDSAAVSATPEAERTREQYEDVLRRHERLLESCEARRVQLEESRKLHEFIRAAGDVIMWMNAKLQLAYDDGFIDPSNLRSKLQKHLAFDAELQASGDRIEAVREDGEKLIADGHFDAETIEAQLGELTNGWAELKAKSANKARHLSNSYELYQLTRKLDELDAWLTQLEHQLSTNDHGEDTRSVEALIEKHKALMADVDAKGSIVADVVERAGALKQEHDVVVAVDDPAERALLIQQRLDGLREPCQIRQDNLLDSLKHFKWADEVDEQLVWIHDKIPQLESRDYGTTLHSAQSLSKRHGIVEQEIGSRQPIAKELITKGQRMASTGGGEVKSRIEKLVGGMEMLKSLAAERSLRLAQSIRSQEYYADAQEAEHWLRERLPLAANADVGLSQDAAASHLRRLNALEQEVEQFGEQVLKLGTTCRGMLAGEHFDGANLSAKQAKVEALHVELSGECRRRRTQLEDASHYHNFVHQADELITWLREKKQLAEREDYGADLEHCCQLIDQFQLVLKELSAAGERVSGVVRLQEELLRGGHPNAGSIRAKGSDLQHLWRDVNDAANDRQQALVDGKAIHVFDQRADEMLDRLAEKEAHIVAQENEDLSNLDGEAMKGHVQRHDDFLHSLFVIEKQVNELCREADKIVQSFPRTEQHLDVRRSELAEQLKDVQDGARKFSHRLTQAQANQAYFQEHRDLMAWLRHMQTVITGEVLPRNIAACSALQTRHNEYRAEIKSREQQKASFIDQGRAMIQQGNVLTSEITAKIDDLEFGFAQLYDIWHRRQRVYDENMDVQQWLHQAESLETWLSEREQFLAEDWHVVENVENAEDLIRRFDDFLATLEAQSPHFEALKRITKLEESYARMRQREQEMFGDESAAAATVVTNRRRSEISQPGRRDTQQIRTMEKKKLLQGKRQERERRKTQEISLLPKRSINEEALLVDPTTLPRARRVASANASQQDLLVVGGEGDAQTTDLLPPTSTTGPSSRQSSEVLSVPLEFDSSMGTDKSFPLRRVPSGRTPGFTTRRPQSIKAMRAWDDLKSIDMHGYLDRKQELQGGGKRATFRSWRGYYTILCGQLLCFFKDEEAFMENVAAAPPVFIGAKQGRGPHSNYPAKCSIYPEYVKRKYTFKLSTADGAEYLFSCENNLKMIEWVEKINFHARLDPKDQLASFHRPSSSDGIPPYSPPLQPVELMRSHTLEIHPSTAHGRTAFDEKSATMDYRRPLSATSEDFFQQRLGVASSRQQQVRQPSTQESASSGAGSPAPAPPPSRRINGHEQHDTETGNFAESSSSSQYATGEETDSLKKKKGGFGSLFKRSSKSHKDVKQ